MRPARPGREIEVRHALDRETGEPLVLKVLLPDASPTLTARFQNECSMTPAESRPFLVRQVNIDAQTPRTLLATEFVSGLSLQQKFQTGRPITFQKKLKILDTLCQAVAEVHHMGVVHGDIAPSNVLVQEDGSSCLIDFGLAQQLHHPHSTAKDTSLKLKPNTESAIAKSATQISGTPGFLSPEAIRLEPLRVESDIYSWGCIAFFLLSETLPFKGRTPIEIIWKQKNQPPPALQNPAKNFQQATTRVHSLVLQCMQTLPEDRPTDINTVRETLIRLRAET